jgi:hypothetical protein
MSGFNAIALLLALGFGHLYVHTLLDTKVMNDIELIVTGAIRGVPVPIKHRRLVFTVRYVVLYGGVIGFNAAWAIGYVLIGQYTDVEGVRLFAYLFAFLSLIVALSWIVGAPTWYRHLAAVLHQAEAD